MRTAVFGEHAAAGWIGVALVAAGVVVFDHPHVGIRPSVPEQRH
jgi:hypothetical protein